MVAPAFLQIDAQGYGTIGRINGTTVSISLFAKIFAGLYHDFFGGTGVNKEFQRRQIERVEDHRNFFSQISQFFSVSKQ
jgi:hypothetical protein